MKSCDYCGRENQDEAARCSECGTTNFIVAGPTSSPEKPQIERTIAPYDPEPDVSVTGETAICTSCLFPNIPDSPFCKRCGAPVGFISTMGPLEHIFAQGHAYRQAVEGRPKLIILVGMWLLFFPSFLFFVLLIFGDHRDPFMLLLNGGLAVICAMLLYRVTKNFMRGHLVT